MGLHLLHVVAGTEPLAGSPDNHDFDRWVFGDVIERVLQCGD